MKILMVMAHPDDEVIFGWPILQDKNIEKELLICSSDENNPKRKWCAKRKYNLFNLCKSLRIPCTCLPYNSAFYKVEARNGDLKKLEQHIARKIGEHSFDFIFTHNPLGEYGMLDHILVHNLVMNVATTKILITDMFTPSIWTLRTSSNIPDSFKRIYYTKLFSSHKLDQQFYNYCKDFYTRGRVWTWSKDPITSSNLFQI